MAKNDAGEIFDLAVKSGMKSMMIDGIEKVLMGITTLEEVLRVIKM